MIKMRVTVLHIFGLVVVYILSNECTDAHLKMEEDSRVSSPQFDILSDQSLVSSLIYSKDSSRRIFEKKKVDRLGEIFTQIGLYYLPELSANLSTECYRDVLAINTAFSNPISIAQNSWALELVDSWGKFEDGIFEGNTKIFGFFEECQRIDIKNDKPEANFIGKYCLMNVAGLETPALQLDRMAPFFIENFGFSLFMFYATCMPSTCSNREFEDSLNDILAENGLSVNLLHCQTEEDPVEFDSAEIFGITFFSCLGFILLVASAFDEITTYKNKTHLREGHYRYLLCFSVPANMKKIFAQRTDASRDSILCIHGIRLLSITWVVLGHQYIYSSLVVSNIRGAAEMTQGFLVQIISNGDKSVDTFLFLSGLMCALTTFKMMDRTKRFSPVAYYVTRFVRLTPAIAVYIIYLATISSYFIRGPLTVLYDEFYITGCRNSWWMDISYLSNYFFRFADDFLDKEGEAMTCISPSWYLAVDMQLYIFMPLILLPIYFYKKKGLIWLGICTFISVLVPAVIIGVNDTYPTSLLSSDSEESLTYTYLVYMMPYCRASPYLVGIWTGYIMWKRPNAIKLNRYQVIGGWTAATVLALVIIFAMYPYNKIDSPNPADDLTTVVSVIYGSLHRGLWAVCIAWVVFACHYGYGGYVNSFLSHPGFQPLSRLSYCIYLVSLPLQYAYLFSIMRPLYSNHLTILTDTCGVLFLIGLGALALTLTSESPIIGVQKLILTKRISSTEKAEKIPKSSDKGREY